jgi:uncharacterized protein (DUF58 family)
VSDRHPTPDPSPSRGGEKKINPFPLAGRGRGGGILETSAQLQFHAEALAARLPALLVEAERVASTVALGVHGRRRSGPGESFWQFRRYQSGDPAALIDWRQSARTDLLYVRETEWMAAQAVGLWSDGSASMRWRSSPRLPEKRERANLLALALAALLVRGGERVGLLGADRPPAMGRAVLTRIAAELMAQDAGGGLPAAHLSRFGHVVLISDFLMPAETVAAALAGWGGAGVHGHLVHLLDPAEESLPYEGRTHFFGLEGEGDMLAPRAEMLREKYQAKLSDHRARLAAAAHAWGWGFTTHRTDQPPEPALLALHQALEGR